MAQDSNYIAPSIFASNVTVAPGANSVLATILSANIPKGYYDVECIIGFNGTAEATTPNNFHFNRAGNILFGFLPCPSVANVQVKHIFRRIYFDGSQSATIQNTIAGSAGAVYNTGLILTPVQ